MKTSTMASGISSGTLPPTLARILRHDSVGRALRRDGRVREVTTRGLVPSGRSIVQPDAHLKDAAHAEPFWKVQIGLRGLHGSKMGKCAQNGGHGKASGQDYEVMAVQVLDEIATLVIKQRGMQLPHCFLDWVNFSATPRVTKMASDLACDPGLVMNNSNDPQELIRHMVYDWFLSQFKVRYGELEAQLPTLPMELQHSHRLDLELT